MLLCLVKSLGCAVAVVVVGFFGLFSWFWCFGFFPAAQLVVS